MSEFRFFYNIHRARCYALIVYGGAGLSHELSGCDRCAIFRADHEGSRVRVSLAS